MVTVVDVDIVYVYEAIIACCTSNKQRPFSARYHETKNEHLKIITMALP